MEEEDALAEEERALLGAMGASWEGGEEIGGSGRGKVVGRGFLVENVWRGFRSWVRGGRTCSCGKRMGCDCAAWLKGF